MKRGSVKESLLRNASAMPDSIAIASSAYEPLSYAGLATEIEAFGAIFRSAGLGHMSRVAIAIGEAPKAALAITCVSCQATAVPLDPNLTPVELEQRLKLLRVDAAILLAGENCPLRRVAEKLDILVIEAISPSGSRLGLQLTPAQREANATIPSVASSLEPPAFILQSSGTTADPKLIPYSHSNMLATSARVRGWFGLDQNDRCLSVSPVYYCHGLTLTVFAPLLSGGSIAFPSNPNFIDIDEWFSSLEPSWFSASPTLHRALLDKIKSTGPIDHRLRFAVSGGAPLSLDTQVPLEAALGVPILEHYGATEAGQISGNCPEPGKAKPGTCGIAPAGTVKIVSEEGAQLAPGASGEILVTGPTVIEGYLDAPDLNESCFVAGWYHTGDIGKLDEDGFLTVQGRLREIINRGGEKISPLEIEVALLRHPDVAEAAAFAIPHPRLGEDVGVAVVLHPHVAKEPADLRTFLGTQIAWFKVPRRIRFLSELPKGSTGKIQRRRLSENSWSG